MSDEKEIKNLDNLTKVDFKKKQTAFKDEFISRSKYIQYYPQILGELVITGSNFLPHGTTTLIKHLWTWTNI